MNNMSANVAPALIELDATDDAIIALLRADGRMPYRAIARELKLTESTVRARVKRLEESGIINGHACLLNQSMLGLKITAYIGISMDRHTPDRFEEFESKVA